VARGQARGLLDPQVRRNRRARADVLLDAPELLARPAKSAQVLKAPDQVFLDLEKVRDIPGRSARMRWNFLFVSTFNIPPSSAASPYALKPQNWAATFVSNRPLIFQR